MLPLTRGSTCTQVVLEGTSREQQLCLEQHIGSIAGEGGKPVLVLDGAAFPPKAAEVARRRATSSGAADAARAAEAQLQGHKAASEWKKASRPAEAFWAWLLQWCLDKDVAFLVSPCEADEQLVALQEQLGDENAIVLAASQDSDQSSLWLHMLSTSVWTLVCTVLATCRLALSIFDIKYLESHDIIEYMATYVQLQ